ncbi:MAG: S8 family serine peptidase [Candidatus Heimdallarchaeota archaeon]|nr:S8 family serine peptidase [Candidatus Heimdallarchaeota archaeon]
MSTDNKLRTTIWSVVISILVLTAGIFIFLQVWIPNREGGEGIKVAVLDSGINMDAKIAGYKVSRELGDSIILEKSFVTTEYGYDSNSTVLDDTDYYHGTLVAMQIASKSFGYAPQANLIIAKCADADGTATYPAIYAAIHWAAYEADADIINLSIGGPIIANNSLVDLINQIALEKGVLTVISAGNNGDSTGYSLSSIEGPGDALQAITVGATLYDGIAGYSSVGPLKDHSIKPDLLESGFTLIAYGTSFSAPKVTGQAAVLSSWCIAQGFKTSPGLLKAALMSSASIEQAYPVYYSGAGIANIELAKTIISNADLVDGWPMVTYVSPSKLPFSMPTVFQGDIWHFPLTIITPVEQEFSFTSDLLPAESIISIPSLATINQSGLVDCKFVIPESFPLDNNHQEVLSIQGSLGGALAVTIGVEITSPKVSLGFDVYHTTWDMDHLIGQFRDLRLELAKADIALIELTHPDNFTNLNKYDALIMPDPNTYGLYLDSEKIVRSYYQAFTNETINAIVNYVEEGNGLFVLGTTSDSAEIVETNRLLNHFNITFLEDTIPDPIIYNENTGDYNIVLITEMNNTHAVTSTLIDFDFIGSKLAIIGNNAQAIAWYQSQSNVAVAAYESANKTLAGRVIVTGSNFMADNWGINGRYLSSNNLNFIIKTIEWITNRTVLASPFTRLQTHSIEINNKPIFPTKITLEINGLFVVNDSYTNTIQTRQIPYLNDEQLLAILQQKKWQKN